MYILSSIVWESKTVLLKERPFLICFGDRCMSGMLSELRDLGQSNKYEALISFIEPDFFKKDLKINNQFTIQEASKILGKGVVKNTYPTI